MLELKGLELGAILLKASSPGKLDFIGFAIQGLFRYEKILWSQNSVRFIKLL
jgi:hypothetical protein